MSVAGARKVQAARPRSRYREFPENLAERDRILAKPVKRQLCGSADPHTALCESGIRHVHASAGGASGALSRPRNQESQQRQKREE
jgi:hypothetical protein